MSFDYEKRKQQLIDDEVADYKYQERRHENWTENYQLYRDKVITNRLTQTQSINVPLIKGIVRTTLANVDQFDDVELEEKGNDKDKEIGLNEAWKDSVVRDRLETKDTVDLKQVLLYGKSWTQFNIIGGRVVQEVKEPFDFVVDRNGDPSDLETCRHITQLHLFRTIDELESNPLYDKAAIQRLKVWYATSQGLIKQEELTQAFAEKQERMANLGLDDALAPGLGSTLVELKVYRFKEYDSKEDQDVTHVMITASGASEILYAGTMRKALGINEYDVLCWSDDPDRTDHYPDGVADTARTTNKMLNSMASSLVLNRVLRNMGMQYYDATAQENWSPAGFQPTPFGWYPLPGKPQDIVQRVDIPDMSESIDEMEYIKKIVEAATAITATLQGDTQQSKVTLGEVELAMGAAKERLGTLAKFKFLAQKDKADKWAKIMNSKENRSRLAPITLYKKSNRGNWFKQELKPSDWQTDDGYNTKVVSKAEREQKNTQGINKLNAVAAQFPNNPVMKKIYQEKLLDFAEVSPDDKQAVMEYEQQQQQMMAQRAQMMMAGQAQAVDPMAQSLDAQTQALQSLTPDPNAGQVTG